METSRLLAALGFVFIGIVSRLLPHPPNFTAINAIALFGPFFLRSRWLSLGTMFATLILSDLILGFHSTMPYTYLSLCVVIWMGYRYKEGMSLQRMPLISLAATLLFFFITNFGVWATTSFYPKALYGLGMCYLAGIPFLLNQAVGDLAYCTLLFVYMYFAEQFVSSTPNQKFYE